MKTQLSLLDEHLKKNRPEFYVTLNSPLTENEIQSLEKKYNIVLPADLKLLYSWKNGQADNSFESFANNSTFMSLDNVLSSMALLTSMIGSDFEIENW